MLNEKGLGYIGVIVFAGFAVVVIYVFYSFMVSLIPTYGPSKMPSRNYTNECRQFMVYTSGNEMNYSNYRNYKDLERSISNYTRNYVDKHYSFLHPNDPLYITTRTLVRDGFMRSTIRINNKQINCSGYTIVLKTKQVTKFNTYIRCDTGYKTKGYVEIYDN